MVTILIQTTTHDLLKVQAPKSLCYMTLRDAWKQCVHQKTKENDPAHIDSECHVFAKWALWGNSMTNLRTQGSWEGSPYPGHTSIDGQSEGPTEKTGRLSKILSLHSPRSVPDSWLPGTPWVSRALDLCYMLRGHAAHCVHTWQVATLCECLGVDLILLQCPGPGPESDKNYSRRVVELTDSAGSLGCSFSPVHSPCGLLHPFSAFLSRSFFSCRCFCGYSPATQLSLFL